MLPKLLLTFLFVLSLVAALVVAPARRREVARESSASAEDQTGRQMRLLSWNIGNGDLETETRAHDEDLPAVAQVILDNDVDAVALQELTGANQLKQLLEKLQGRYQGSVCSAGSSDRVEAVLVKKQTEISAGAKRGKGAVKFKDVPADDRCAASATFRLQADLPEILLISAHADAFNAARRRTFAAEIVDWTQGKGELVFIAGDFNLEVSTRNKNNLFTDDAKNDSESYAHLLKYFRDFGLDAGETSINDRRIDYVFGSPIASLRRAEVLRGAAVGRMDHWPLLVEVGLSPLFND